MVLFLSRYTLVRLSFGPCTDLVRSCFGKHPNEVRTRCERKRTESGRRVDGEWKESGRRVEGDQNDRRGRCPHRSPFLPRHRLSVSVPGGVDRGRAFPRWRTRERAFWPLAEKLSFNGIASYVHSAKNVVPGSWK
jgi:hypothetical protein